MNKKLSKKFRDAEFLLSQLYHCKPTICKDGLTYALFLDTNAAILKTFTLFGIMFIHIVDA